MIDISQGTLALVGAGEFLPLMQPVDRLLLERLQTPPRILIVPTASAPDGPGVPERWIHMGIEHFTQLGAHVEGVLLLNRTDADDTAHVEKLNAANFIYFSGGKPRYLLETLQGTAVWKAVQQVLARGGIVAGCSAGAMVMGSELFDFPQVWRTIPALGLVPGIAIIPHFDEIPRFVTAPITSGLGRKTTVIGIDGATALIGSGAQWMVQGKGSITVFHEKRKQQYHAGEIVTLDDPTSSPT